jgi:hypothetical protein
MEMKDTPLAQIRRLEVIGLFIVAVFLAMDLPGLWMLLDLPIVAAGLLLFPRLKRQIWSSREARRLYLLEELLVESMRMRGAYEDARHVPDDRKRPKALGKARYQAEGWIEIARARLRSYPEIAGIFESHNGASLREELDGRIHRLSQLKRLAEISYEKDLPI